MFFFFISSPSKVLLSVKGGVYIYQQRKVFFFKPHQSQRDRHLLRSCKKLQKEKQQLGVLRRGRGRGQEGSGEDEVRGGGEGRGLEKEREKTRRQGIKERGRTKLYLHLQSQPQPRLQPQLQLHLHLYCFHCKKTYYRVIGELKQKRRKMVLQQSLLHNFQ